MQSREQPTLCVFAKAPRPGAVKTRLAEVIGMDAAAHLARAFLTDTLAPLYTLSGARRIVALSGDPSQVPRRGADVEVWAQGDGDLGARMERVLERALSTSSRALALGADSPGLPLAFISEALSSLQAYDAVLGPADDGGFYLLGLRACPAGLLTGLPWSAPDTRERTVERLRSHRLDVSLLRSWFDVDTVADLTRLSRMLATGEVVAPATAQALRQLSWKGQQ